MIQIKVAILCLLLSGAAYAQSGLEEALQIEISADRAELSQPKNQSIYSGNVKLKRGGLRLWGDRLIVRRDPKTGAISTEITGRPARIQQAADGAQPELSAEAKRLEYDMGGELITMQGDVKIQRGTDALSGENVIYNMKTARIEANGAGKGPIQIIITPPANMPLKFEP